MHFREKLERAWERSGSLLCVGLDPDPALLPSGFGPDDVALFNRSIIEATSDLVCAYKPNVAFYEALGPERGYRMLRETLAAVPPGIVTLADAKRGDVEHTARAYARAFFDNLGFDAATVNPYLGPDSLAPWLERPEHAAFILCRTSNPGAPELQDLRVEDGDTPRPLYEVIAERAASWSRFDNIGLVVGATYPAEMGSVRSLAPTLPVLVPGVGAQRGDLTDAVIAGADSRGRGLLVNASRGVTYASRGEDFARAARLEAERLRDEIRSALAAPAAR